MVLGDRGENRFQPLPLAELLDFPAMQIQVGNATVLLNMVERVQEVALPIRGSIVSAYEI